MHEQTNVKHFNLCNVAETLSQACQVTAVQRITHAFQQLECGPKLNVMAALPNIGGALCSTPQSLADAQYWNALQ